MPHIDGLTMSGAAFIGPAVLANGTAVTYPMQGCPLPAVAWAEAVTGDTVTITYSVDGGANYRALVPANVTSGYQEWRIGTNVTHLKFQRTAGSGTTSTYGVA